MLRNPYRLPVSLRAHLRWSGIVLRFPFLAGLMSREGMDQDVMRLSMMGFNHTMALIFCLFFSEIGTMIRQLGLIAQHAQTAFSLFCMVWPGIPVGVGLWVGLRLVSLLNPSHFAALKTDNNELGEVRRWMEQAPDPRVALVRQWQVDHPVLRQYHRRALHYFLHGLQRLDRFELEMAAHRKLAEDTGARELIERRLLHKAIKTAHAPLKPRARL
jgi:hypothetical protein